jgi:hypothetical protein
MGPAFNPFFWLLCIAFLVVAAVVAFISKVLINAIDTLEVETSG